MLSVNLTATLGIFRLTVVRQSSSTIVSMAAVESVTSDNDGATITCNDDIVSNAGSLSTVVRVTGRSAIQLVNVESTVLHVDPPGISSNVQVIPLTLTSMKLTWDPPLNFNHCVQSYVAQFINGTDSTNFSITNNATMFIVTGLTQGVHYGITVAARDGQGRTGEESKQVFYTLDGRQIQNVKSSY